MEFMERFERPRRRAAETSPTLVTDPRIDWASRADGKEHTLTRGEHFSREARLVQRAAWMWGSRNGLRAVTRISADGTTIVVMFVPLTGKV